VTAAVVKSYNIGEIIVIEILAVNLENFRVIAENIGEFAASVSLLERHVVNPMLKTFKVELGEIDILRNPLYAF
jgi:hypothetical protein